MAVQGTVGLGGLLQGERAGDVDAERAGLDQMVEFFENLRIDRPIIT